MESQLRRQLADISEIIIEGGEVNVPTKNQLLIEADSLIAGLEKIVSEIYTDNPRYCRFRYDYHVISLDKLQSRIDENESVIEFIACDDSIFCLVIKKEEIGFIGFERDLAFSQNLDDQFAVLHSPVDPATSQIQYRDAAFALYQRIFSNAFHLIDENILLIIPDGPLINLPFEALVEDTMGNEFRNFNYLFRNHSIRYWFSATIATQKANLKKEKSVGMLVLAPDFSARNNISADSDDVYERESTRWGLPPLPGAQDEANFLRDRFGALALTGLIATETNFRLAAEKSSCVHFATHTILYDSFPLHTVLFLESRNDPANDGLLSVEEIIQMNLNLDMAFLSACESGVGKMLEGEGTMCLFRAFAYAGCPSLIFSLWRLNDWAVGQLVKSFYNNLNNGIRKDLALSNAKRAYLLAAKDNYFAQPFFWSNLVLVGDVSPVKFARRNTSGWIYLLITATLVFTLGCGGHLLRKTWVTFRAGE